jgi:tetratricopeptide (TPR) repeat protein
MGDIFIEFLRESLPEELASELSEALRQLENGDFLAIFENPVVQVLLGHKEKHILKDVTYDDFPSWSDYIFHRLGIILSKRDDSEGTAVKETASYRQHLLLIVAVAALHAFIQSNVTGPPLPFSSSKMLLPHDVVADASSFAELRRELVSSLSVDGVAAYKLTPNIELFCLAQTILICPPIQKNVKAVTWARLRVNFFHQRLLSEIAPTLQNSIYEDLETLENSLFGPDAKDVSHEMKVSFLLERAAIHTHHGFDKKARADLNKAASERKFDFAITGLLGKRTKFQQKDISQLVVLAHSADSESNGTSEEQEKTAEFSNPKNLDLNDDTLLESISFTENAQSTEVKDGLTLPDSLTSLDPGNQPLLHPLDSIILLSLASSITNTNPADGLTREETLPYATRVLEGGSSNWQVYTQALLVRSRIEGYRSRTMERGLLQLQALVDQVIAETSVVESPESGAPESTATTFLPKPMEGESAPVSERLRYIFPLSSPTRWELEAELASRWVHVGGLRTALEIYERLEMWAEAALCWAATEREDKAKKIVRKQLFHASNGDDEAVDPHEEEWNGTSRDPPPPDAPRLYCILGDIDRDTSMYEKAWEVSGNRYARAQRSLGRHYITEHDYEKAAEAYSLSLKINALNHQAWFALGCAYLELKQFKNAVEAFSRCVQLDDEDAEAWSNLAAALLHLRPKSLSSDEQDEARVTSHPRQDALKAFKRAAGIKHDNAKIWSNVLTVAASTNPPSYNDIVTAQRRLCELRGPKDGEKCIDEDIFDLLVHHIVEQEGGFDPSKPGLPRIAYQFIEKEIKPLITASPRLWTTLSKLYLHTNRPASALDAREKAWRAVTSQPKWETGTEKQWEGVVQQTIDLVDAYETLGPRERTEGLAAGTGELVCKGWKFKAKSAVTSVMGKAKDTWEDSAGWERLKERLDELKGRD